MPPTSLYIHIPFCHRRCPYCSFYHVHSSSGTEDAFVGALVDEAERTLGEFHRAPVLKTVYFGGGTPSVLSNVSWSRIFDTVARFFPGDEGEITCEFNPEDVTDGLLDFLSDLGVNRASLGVQSMDAASQARLKRCPPDANREAIARVERRFENVNFDVLLGVPGGSTAALSRTIDELLGHGPAHFSVYCLEPGGDLEREVERFFDDVDPDRSADEYMLVCDRLESAGYNHYEVSNFARPGMESRHNRTYWEGEEFLGLGPGAHSYVGGRRFHNVPSLESYLEPAGGPQEARRIYDDPAPEEKETERLMLALRTSRGAELESLRCSDGAINAILDEGLAVTGDGRLRLTDRGYLLMNEIVLRLCRAL
jgi:oxygen-independent coproporphyrinogen-3 oxidase